MPLKFRHVFHENYKEEAEMEQKKLGKHNAGWVAGMVSAVLVGAALGVFFAPKSGKETRTILRNRINDARSKMNNRGK